MEVECPNSTRYFPIPHRGGRFTRVPPLGWKRGGISPIRAVLTSSSADGKEETASYSGSAAAFIRVRISAPMAVVIFGAPGIFNCTAMTPQYPVTWSHQG